MLMYALGRQSATAEIRLSVERGAQAERRGRVVQTTAKLSKRHVPSSRPAFSQAPDPNWRGMQVDYATALPQPMLRQLFQETVPSGSLAVIQVDKDSLAWKAGLRPGTLLTHVDGQQVTTTEAFFAAVADKAGEVRLRLFARDRPEAIVPAAQIPNPSR